MSGVSWSADQHGQVMALLHRIDRKLGLLMTAQADVDNAVSILLELTSNLLTTLQQLQTDLAGQDVDTSKLDAALPPLQDAVTALQQLAASSAPTTGTTGTTTTPGTSTTGTTTTTNPGSSTTTVV